MTMSKAACACNDLLISKYFAPYHREFILNMLIDGRYDLLCAVLTPNDKVLKNASLHHHSFKQTPPKCHYHGKRVFARPITGKEVVDHI